MEEIEKLKTITASETLQLVKIYGSPLFIYSRKAIEKNCEDALGFPNEFGITVRYAMKANPNSAILKIIRSKGVHLDASSGYEVKRALHAGFLPQEIMLTSQEVPDDFQEIIEEGTLYNACSLHQLENFGKHFPGKKVSIRINPGTGSGGNVKTNVGGNKSSFGIWHEYLPDIFAIRDKYKLEIYKVHTHIGSGSDPEVWKGVAHLSLGFAEKFPECTILNLGGGFKIARMADEITTDFIKIGTPVRELFIDFLKKTGRKLHLEIEPGTRMVANTGCLVSRVEDVVNTGKDGYSFVKLNSGMDSNTRPSLYGARHPLITIPLNEADFGKRPIVKQIVTGHCCESGDLFTQKEGGEIDPRSMEEAHIGDYMVMEGCGAYCAGMSVKNYNSFPEAKEVLRDHDGSFKLIRRRQTLHQMIQNELPFEA